MSRLGLIPELTFAEYFKQLRRDIAEIKTAQRIGRDIIKPKIVECLDVDGNPTEYDLVTVVDEFGFGSDIDFTATLFAENQQQPWGSLFVKGFYGSPGVPVTDGQMSGFFYLSQGKTNPGSIGYRGSAGTAQFEDTTLLYLKFYMYATDNGTLEVLPEYIE